MLQKNKLSPFHYSLLAVSITGILFVIFGFNGWGPSAENEQAIGEISRWCERVSAGFFREPSNTLGNLGFVFAGLYMFYKLSDDATNNKSPMFGSFKIALLYAAASTFLGPGSMAMHGTHTKFGAWLDNVSMIAYILLLWIYNLKKLTHFSSKTYFSSYTILLIYYAYSYWYLDSGLGIGVNLFELSIGLWIATEVLIKFPNAFGRIMSGITVLIIQQLFGSPVISENSFFGRMNNDINKLIVLFQIQARVFPQFSRQLGNAFIFCSRINTWLKTKHKENIYSVVFYWICLFFWCCSYMGNRCPGSPMV